MKFGSLLLLGACVGAIVETAYFGFNLLPVSTEEIIADAVCLSIAVVGLVFKYIEFVKSTRKNYAR